MAEVLRKRLAAFYDEAEQIHVALGEREWSHSPVQVKVETLLLDLDDVIHDLSHLIHDEEAWTEEE